MKITLNEKLGKQTDPYLIRWVVDFGIGSIRLHHWRHSDDLRYPHDHAWDFLTIILYGSYLDVSPDELDKLDWGQLAFRKAEHKHSVRITSKHCWTLMFTGPERRVWGFWVNGKFRKRNKYFFEHGHHAPD